MKALLALAVLAAALPAHAGSDDFVADATKSWNENILPAEAINWIKFRGEDGIERTLWYFYKDLPNTKTWRGSVPLFVLDAAPAVEARTMRSQTGFYPDKFEDLKVSLAIFKKNQVSPYYIMEWDDSNFWLGRRDRAETRLRGDRPGVWYLYSGIVANQSGYKYASVNGVVPWARVQIYKPEGPGLTPATPLTAFPLYNWCSDISGSWKNGPEPSQQLSRGFTPHDVLIWQSGLQPSVSAPGIWNALYEQGKAGIAKGDYTKGAEYIDWFRKQAAGAVETTGATSAERAKRADATFSPAESKYLVCRMRHAGKEDEFLQKADKLNGEAATKTFVAAWRQFVLAELKAYLDESKTAPRLPRLAEHETLSNALAARAEKALSGSPAAPANVTRPKTAARPQKQTAALPDAEDVFK